MYIELYIHAKIYAFQADIQLAYVNILMFKTTNDVKDT